MSCLDLEQKSNDVIKTLWQRGEWTEFVTWGDGVFLQLLFSLTVVW